MELFAGMLIGALMGSAAAAMMGVDTWRGIHLHATLGTVGALMGAVALTLLFPGTFAQLQDEFLVWCVTGAAGLLALATVANVVELALDFTS